MFKRIIGFGLAAVFLATLSVGTLAAKSTTKTPTVVMYATKTCGYCAKARAYFREHGVAWKERDIEASEQAHREWKELGGVGTPLIVIGNERISGFNKARLDALIGAR